MKKAIILILIIACVSGLVYSGIYIVLWIKDNNKTNEQIENVQNKVKVEEKDDSEDTVIIDEDSNYLDSKFLNVSFDVLHSINNEVVGWIYIPGTKIDYPFVKHSDNKFYLNHSIDKTYSGAGWVFMDYRNNISNLDQNTIIYAHGRIDGTMFGSLRNALEKKWLDNKDNYVLKISSRDTNYLFEIFSIYHIKSTTDYLTINYDSDDDYLKFLKMIQDRSFQKFDTSVGVLDKIVTLSTCYSSSEKLVVHAKLIKSEKNNW